MIIINWKFKYKKKHVSPATWPPLYASWFIDWICLGANSVNTTWFVGFPEFTMPFVILLTGVYILAQYLAQLDQTKLFFLQPNDNYKFGAKEAKKEV